MGTHTDGLLHRVAAPHDGQEASSSSASVPATQSEIPDLATAISQVTANTAVYTETELPPGLPIAGKHWVPERAEDAPHDPNVYFPMRLYK